MKGELSTVTSIDDSVFKECFNTTLSNSDCQCIVNLPRFVAFVIWSLAPRVCTVRRHPACALRISIWELFFVHFLPYFYPRSTIVPWFLYCNFVSSQERVQLFHIFLTGRTTYEEIVDNVFCGFLSKLIIRPGPKKSFDIYDMKDVKTIEIHTG